VTRPISGMRRAHSLSAKPLHVGAVRSLRLAHLTCAVCVVNMDASRARELCLCLPATLALFRAAPNTKSSGGRAPAHHRGTHRTGHIDACRFACPGWWAIMSAAVRAGAPVEGLSHFDRERAFWAARDQHLDRLGTAGPPVATLYRVCAGCIALPGGGLSRFKFRMDSCARAVSMDGH